MRPTASFFRQMKSRPQPKRRLILRNIGGAFGESDSFAPGKRARAVQPGIYSAAN
jgi:hypothetical protein